jgi:hypothetical protein
MAVGAKAGAAGLPPAPPTLEQDYGQPEQFAATPE